jgi:hypothetical protein
MARPAPTVLLIAALAARSATLCAQDPTPDEVQRALHALPVNPQVCLSMANRCWDPSVAQPLFDCWLATASREDLVRQATSGSWTVRGLALRALTQAGPARASQLDALRASPGSAPAFEWLVSQVLFTSLVDVLSQNVSEHPAPNTISRETARQARDALWEVSDRNMTLVLPYADRIRPISGRDGSAGRFGESSDLASRDPNAYAARRRAWQLLAAGVLAILLATLRVVKVMRTVATALLAAVFMWAAWFSFQTDVRELPPPPLIFLTASCLAFLSAGLVSGVIARFRIRGPLNVAVAAFGAAVCAFFLCFVTRSAGLFPIGTGAWGPILEPIGSAALAAPAAVVISLGLGLDAGSSGTPVTSGAGAPGRPS